MTEHPKDRRQATDKRTPVERERERGKGDSYCNTCRRGKHVFNKAGTKEPPTHTHHSKNSTHAATRAQQNPQRQQEKQQRETTRLTDGAMALARDRREGSREGRQRVRQEEVPFPPGLQQDRSETRRTSENKNEGNEHQNKQRTTNEDSHEQSNKQQQQKGRKVPIEKIQTCESEQGKATRT